MNIFSTVKHHISILDVAQEYTGLKRAGNYWKGQCPFHHERTASFTVSPLKGIYYCFGCHQGGDVISFIAKIENCSALEAAKHLADRYHVDLPDDNSTQKTSSKQEKELYTRTHETVALWCAEQLKKSGAAKKYLNQRGITDESIEIFSLGYFPGGTKALKELLTIGKEKNLLAHDFIQAHIIRASERDMLYSPYEERITFPIHDALGRACGLGGRIFNHEDSRAKYYNSQDHASFNKGSLLYGFHRAKAALQESGYVYLVEGYLDTIAFWQAGLKQTVATLGTACTAEHIKNLSRHVDKLYTVYDGDAAGEKAALRLTNLCWDVDLEPYVIQLPRDEDPCSLVAHGYPVHELRSTAITIFEYFIQKTGFNGMQSVSLQERISQIKSIMDLIGTIKDPIKQDLLLQQAASACNVPYETLKNSLSGPPKALAVTKKEPLKNIQRTEHNTQIEISDLEKKIFSGIIDRKYILTSEEYNFLSCAFSPYLMPIIERFNNLIGQGNSPSINDICSETEHEYIISLLMEDEVKGEGPPLEELFLQFYKKKWKMIVNGVKIKIAQAQKLNHNKELEKIITQFQSLKQKLFVKDEI